MRHEKYIDTVKWNERNFWNSVAKNLGLSRNYTVKYMWTENYAKSAPINKSMMQIVKRLRKNSYKLAVLSNTIPDHIKANRKRGLYKLFHFKIFSCDPKVNCKSLQ